MVSYNLDENTCNPSPVAITEKRGACFLSAFSGWLPSVMGSIPQGKGICQRRSCREDPTWFFSAHTHEGSNGHIAYPLILIHSAQGRCLRGGKEIRKECWTQPSSTQWYKLRTNTFGCIPSLSPVQCSTLPSSFSFLLLMTHSSPSPPSPDTISFSLKKQYFIPRTLSVLIPSWDLSSVSVVYNMD